MRLVVKVNADETSAGPEMSVVPGMSATSGTAANPGEAEVSLVSPVNADETSAGPGEVGVSPVPPVDADETSAGPGRVAGPGTADFAILFRRFAICIQRLIIAAIRCL